VRFRRQQAESSGSPPVERVLVATDRSETAARAVGWAAEMAERYEAELVVVQVLVPQPGTPLPSIDGVEAELTRYVRDLAGERGYPKVVIGEDPAKAIIDAAADEEVDVVVVGSVGMSGRKEFLLGNVPNRVSHGAPCTVVIVNTAAVEKRKRSRR
jgi:nucleotide-binding universal stress UspA family protein